MRGALSLAPALALVLAACAAPPQEFGQAPPPPSATGLCSAEAAQFAVGQPYGEALGDQARRGSGASVVRTIRPGQVVTMDYRDERLTLDLDDAGRVTRVRCG